MTEIPHGTDAATLAAALQTAARTYREEQALPDNTIVITVEGRQRR